MREKFDSILGKVREKDEGKGGGGETLPEWIVDDCNSKEIAKINGILASKNIKFAF